MGLKACVPRLLQTAKVCRGDAFMLDQEDAEKNIRGSIILLSVSSVFPFACSFNPFFNGSLAFRKCSICPCIRNFIWVLFAPLNTDISVKKNVLTYKICALRVLIVFAIRHTMRVLMLVGCFHTMSSRHYSSRINNFTWLKTIPKTTGIQYTVSRK